MLRIDQLRLLPDQPESDLTAKCARLLRTDPSSLRDLTVLRRAIDAREGLTFVYTVAVSAPQEAALLRRCRDKRVTAYVPEHYVLPAPVAPPEVRPIVVGAGPAGLFAAPASQVARLAQALADKRAEEEGGAPASAEDAAADTADAGSEAEADAAPAADS